MATTETFEPNRLYEIPLGDLQLDPNQPRKYLDPGALDELTASVREQKVIAPIVFRTENSICYIVAGERRCIAARKAGLATIPALYTDKPNYEAISLAENTIRADLTAVEEAEALDRLQKNNSYKLEDLSKVMGKAVSTISEVLSINRLPQSIRDECRKNTTVSKRTLIEIAAKKQERGMIKAYEAYKASINPVKKEKTDPPTQAQSTVKAAETAKKKIETIEPLNLYLEEKADLTVSLNALKEAIEILLAAITEPVIEELPTDDAAAGGFSPKTAAPATKARKQKKKRA